MRMAGIGSAHATMERQLADLALVDTGKPETEPNAASFSDCAVALGGAIALAGDAVPSELQRLCTQVPSGQSDAFGDMVLRSMQANGFGATTRMLAAAMAEVADPAVFVLHSLRHICRSPNKGAVAACTVSPTRIQLGTACAIHIFPHLPAANIHSMQSPPHYSQAPTRWHSHRLFPTPAQ